MLSACFFTCTAFLSSACGRKGSRSVKVSKLDRGKTDSAAAAMNQKPLSGCQPSTLKHIVPDRKHCLRQRRRLYKTQSPRHRETMLAVHRRVLSITAARKQSADGVSASPAPHFRAYGFNQP